MSGQGITDLAALLAGLAPVLAAEEYIFCTFPDGRYGDLAALRPEAAVQEAEGLTLVLRRSTAEAEGIPFAVTFQRITLTVHSSLEAVGLTAAVAGRLAEAGISANMVAGYYHDHIYVPAAAAEEALALLSRLGASGDRR